MNITSNTYSLGSIESLVNCTTVLLYNSNDYTDTKLSINNLVSIYKRIKEIHIPYIQIEKDKGTEEFLYELDKARESGLNSGFDEIIYLNSDKSAPIGYTELQNLIGNSVNVRIKVNLSTGIEEGVKDLTLSFLLTQVTENLYTLKDYTGDSLYEYTKLSKIIKDPINRFSPYVNNIGCILKNDKRVVYLGDRSIINKEGTLELHKLGILEDKEVDPFRNNFQTYKIGRYGNDIAVYAWSKIKNGDKYQIDYCINSLTICNKFDNLLQYVHTKDDDGCCTIPDIIENGKTATDINVLYVTDKYIVCEGIFEDGTSVIKVLNTDSEESFWVNLPDDFICISEWETIPEIIRLTNKKINFSLDSTREVLEKYPDIYSTYLDTRNLSSFLLKRKIGEWYLIQKSMNSGTAYVLAGKYSTIYLTEEDVSRLIIINNNTIMIKEDTYYLLYTGINKTWYTERYRATFYDSSFTEYKGIKFANIGDNVKKELSDTTYKNYYDKGYIKIIQNTDQLCNTVLNRYRRNKYPLDLDNIPNIVDACEGVIFYINNGKINYL